MDVSSAPEKRHPTACSLSPHCERRVVHKAGRDLSPETGNVGTLILEF